MGRRSIRNDWRSGRSTVGALRTRTVPAAATAVSRLSAREIEVLRLMARGANNHEIAHTLHVSERTVKSHVGTIFSKMGVRDRAGAIVLAFESGIAPQDP